MKPIFVGLLCLPLLASCDSPGDVYYCTDEGVFSLVVNVQDSLTGTLVQGSTIRVVATDAAYADTVTASAGREIGVVVDRPGTYQLAVNASGYRPWVKTGIRVDMADRCHVRSVTLSALMQSSGS